MPRFRKQGSETGVGNRVKEVAETKDWSVANGSAQLPQRTDTSTGRQPATGQSLQGEPWALPPQPPECPPELLQKFADVVDKVERGWSMHHRELGLCLLWRKGEPTIKAAGGLYGRLYDPEIGRSDAAHRVVWRRVYGDIPDGMTVDHLCEMTLCERPDHLVLVSVPENTRRRHLREREAVRSVEKQLRSRCSLVSSGRLSSGGRSASTSCADCSAASRSWRTSTAAAAGRRRHTPKGIPRGATPAWSPSAAWCSTVTAWRLIPIGSRASTGWPTRRHLIQKLLQWFRRLGPCSVDNH